MELEPHMKQGVLLAAASVLLLQMAALTVPSLAARHVLLASAPTPAVQPEPKARSGPGDEFLAAHNQARAEVRVPPLQWSSKLYSDAVRFGKYQRDHQACDFANLTSNPYGVNQAWASYLAAPAQVVGSWVEEGKQYYDHAINKCEAGHDCGTYTQVVWRKTTDLGCTQVTCANPQGASLTICLYFPHGTVQGQSPY